MSRIRIWLACLILVTNSSFVVDVQSVSTQKPIVGLVRSKPNSRLPYGVVQRILILPTNPTINEDQRIQFQAYGFDDKGNEIEDAPSWRVEGVGQISQSGLYSPNKTGSATVFAQIQNKYVSTSVTIKPKGSSPSKSVLQWPMFGRNTYRTGFVEDSFGPQTRKVVPIWQRETKKPVNNSMVYGNDLLFAGSGDGNYDIINPVTGECNARIVSDKYSFDTVVVVGNTVIIASYSNPYIICFDYTKDKIIWQATAGPLNSELLYSGGAILFSTTNYRFLCMSADKGKFLWGFDTGKEIWSSPSCSDTKYFVGTDKNSFICFDAKTKKTSWKVSICGGLKYPPVVGKDKVYFSAFNEKECKMYCYAIANGQLCWEYKIDRAIVSSPALSPDKVCFTSLDGKLYCLDANKGNLLWSYASANEIYCSPVIYGQKVIFGSDDHIVRCVDMADGILVWQLETKEAIRSSPLVYNGFIYIASMDKNVYCLGDFDDNITLLGINPLDVTVKVGGSLQFTATGKNKYGQTIKESKVKWSLKGSGTITDDGLFTAGDKPETVYIKAESGSISIQSTVRVVNVEQYMDLCSDWTMLGKDERNSKRVDGACFANEIKSMKLAWKKKFDTHSLSNIIKKGNKLFYATNQGQAMCMDKITGEMIWEVSQPRKINTTMLYHENRLYFGTVEGTLDCISALDGSSMWSFQVSGHKFEKRNQIRSIRSSPVVYDNKIIFGSTNGFLYCLDALNGTMLWNYECFKDVDMSKLNIDCNIDTTPACKSGFVYVGSFNKFFYCIEIKTGSLKWKRYMGSELQSSPTINNNIVCFGARDGHLFNLNATNGDLNWKFKAGKQIWSSPTILYDKVYVGSDDEKLYCLDVFSGVAVWKTALSGWIQSSPVFVKDRLFVGSHTKKIYCINAIDGKIISNYILDAAVSCVPVLSEGYLYVSSQKAEVCCYKLE